MGTCVDPLWFSKCGGTQGTTCGSPAGSGEGCYEPNASSCVDCDRGIAGGNLVESEADQPASLFMAVAVATPGKWAKAGLERGDLIILINGQHIQNRGLLQKYLAQPGTLEITFERIGSGIATIEVEN